MIPYYGMSFYMLNYTNAGVREPRPEGLEDFDVHDRLAILSSIAGKDPCRPLWRAGVHNSDATAASIPG